MIVLVKACKDKKFLYLPQSAHKVNPAKADFICEVLNRNNYKLESGYIWHKIQVDKYDRAFIYAENQSFICGKKSLKEVIK